LEKFMVSSVGSNNTLQSILSILQSNESSSNSTSSTGSTNSSSDSVGLSGPAQLFNELQQLASSDPTKFKEVAAQIAQQLETAAGESDSSTGSSSSTGGVNQMLANLASKFEEAAETGNVSVLQPPSAGTGQSNGVGAGSGQSLGVGMYNQQGQMLTDLSQNSSSSSGSGTSLQSLFNSINQEVASALSSVSSTNSTNA
jgi:hypothetical protein